MNFPWGGIMNFTYRSEVVFTILRKLFRVGGLLTLSFFLLSCSTDQIPGSQSATQQQLLMAFDKNRLLWAQAGVVEYAFSVDKQCDCPEELTSTMLVTEEELEEDDELNFKARNKNAQTRVLKFSSQTRQMENLFSDLRNAIVQNQVRNVTYNNAYGFPKTVSIQASNDLSTKANIEIQTKDFRAIRTVVNVASIKLSGKLFRTAKPNGSNQYWLIEDSGTWNELLIPPNLNSSISSIANNSRVEISGDWIPGGLNGQGLIAITTIISQQNSTTNQSLTGILMSLSANNELFKLVTNDNQFTILRVPNNLITQTLSLVGQRVDVFLNSSSATGFQNSIIDIISITPNPLVLEQLEGTLVIFSSATGTQLSRYFLVDALGKLLELRLPNSMVALANSLKDKRVSVSGVRRDSGQFNQQIIEVEVIAGINNIFADIEITGTIVDLYPTVGFIPNERYALQLESGTRIDLRVPITLQDTANPLLIGMKVKVVGTWNNSGATGQGEFETRIRPIILSNSGLIPSTHSGFISLVGEMGNTTSCSGKQLVYTLITENGQSMILNLDNSTVISGLENRQINLPYRAHVQATGTLTNQNILRTQSISVIPQQVTVTKGTVQEIGPTGDSFSCTGTIYTYKIIDDNGFVHPVSATSSSYIQGSQGAFLKIGDRVEVTGTSSTYEQRIYANSIVATNAETSVSGTIIGFDCLRNDYNSYAFVDESGRLLNLIINRNVIIPPRIFIGVSTRLQATGMINNNELTASQINVHPVSTLPFVPTPKTGSIISLTNTETLTCGNLIHTYSFQNDNGKLQRLRLSSDVASGFAQPLTPGSKLKINRWAETHQLDQIDALEIEAQGSNLVTINGTVTAVDCTNEFRLVDNEGSVYQLKVNAIPNNVFINLGTHLIVTGELLGSELTATKVLLVPSPPFFPQPFFGTIIAIDSNESLSCGNIIYHYTFLNDNGAMQRLRVATDAASSTPQPFTINSRVEISAWIESLDKSVIDVLSVSIR